MCRLLGLDASVFEDTLVDVAAGDVVYVSDYSEKIIDAASDGLYSDWRARGIRISFRVYDILPILKPEFFPSWANTMHTDWLTAISQNADQLICISDSVAAEVKQRLNETDPTVQQHLIISSVHLGADFSVTDNIRPLDSDVEAKHRMLSSRPTFLMVGTVEPRKGYLQTIAAFDLLWKEGVDVNLAIVGAEGWKGLPNEERRTIPTIVSKLHNHPEAGLRLWWLQGLDNSQLVDLYRHSTCLIAASEGEGFGLPLVEAARHGLPILARDIPVFREVAGEYASYFGSDDGESIARTIKAWLAEFEKGTHCKSEGMSWLTWADSVRDLKRLLLSHKAECTIPSAPI